jgi:hypothetical protein
VRLSGAPNLEVYSLGAGLNPNEQFAALCKRYEHEVFPSCKGGQRKQSHRYLCKRSLSLFSGHSLFT